MHFLVVKGGDHMKGSAIWYIILLQQFKKKDYVSALTIADFPAEMHILHVTRSYNEYEPKSLKLSVWFLSPLRHVFFQANLWYVLRMHPYTHFIVINTLITIKQM